MNFRFTLTHDVLGSHEINEPDGWKDCKIKLERDKNFRSLVEYFDGDFIFYGSNGVVDGGLDFIKEVEQAYGVDATIQILIEVSFDGFTYDNLFEGQLNLSGIQEMPDNKAQIPIIRDDFWAKFINRLETPVDLQSPVSLDEESINTFDSVSLNMTSQKVQQQFFGELSKGVIMGLDWPGTTDFNGDNIQWSPDLITLDEIDERFSIPAALNPEIPVSIFTFEFGGDYRIQAFVLYGLLATAAGVTTPIDFGGSSDLRFYYQINDRAPVEFPFLSENVDITVGGPSDDTGSFVNSGFLNAARMDTTESLNAGDELRIYAITTGEFSPGGASGVNFIIYGKDNLQVDASNILGIGLGGTINFGEIDAISNTRIEITAQTTYPNTNSFGFLLHDAAGQIADRIISREESFYSEFLGSTNTVYRQYYADGCGWKYALLKGLQLRLYSLIEKPFFLSFKQWWEGANPILCLGLGYETINGQQVIRVENLEDFYDASETSLDISNVRQITRLYDQEQIFKTVKVGYKKWQAEDISGLDDPQTKHTYATRFQKVGKEFQIESDFIAASLAIETTRRKTKEKSADYKFDDETFIIALNPIPVDVSPETSPDVTDYSPELDENFTSVSNLLNSETRYNLRITPARNLIRWIRYISGSLQSYLSSKFKFTSGEGNYDMVSDMSNVSDGCDEFKPSLAENEDIPVYADPLHLALAYEIVIPLEWEDYLLIRENRKKAIGISQTTVNHAKFFIDTLEYELVKGVATIKAWPVTYFDIQVIESDTFMRDCQAVITEVCEDAYLTENSFELITEDGDCLILE